jgi:hypothetical protein
VESEHESSASVWFSAESAVNEVDLAQAQETISLRVAEIAEKYGSSHVAELQRPISQPVSEDLTVPESVRDSLDCTVYGLLNRETIAGL